MSQNGLKQNGYGDDLVVVIVVVVVVVVVIFHSLNHYRHNINPKKEEAVE